MAENSLVKQAHKHIRRAVGLYSNLTMRAGFEAEDATQEILTIFCGRLQGHHPYDPQRASLPNYCTMLARSVLINRLNKRRRHSIGYDRLSDEFSNRVGELDVDALSELVTPEDPEPAPPWFHACG